jgi:hypothetical protein
MIRWEVMGGAGWASRCGREGMRIALKNSSIWQSRGGGDSWTSALKVGSVIVRIGAVRRPNDVRGERIGSGRLGMGIVRCIKKLQELWEGRREPINLNEGQNKSLQP